jgi:4-amino-4-deoxy-L-arabinose transferase-like glycosyltransferase
MMEITYSKALYAQKIPTQDNHTLNHWFYLFLILHLTAWTLAPLLIRYTLPMDSIEESIWSHQLAWGYEKNPYLVGFLVKLAIFIGGYSSWPLYLFSQISVALGLWAIWELAKKILPPINALIAVMMLEGTQYYNFHAIDFNDNTLEVGLWPLTILFFYHALRKQAWLPWLLVGLFAGLGVMAKYYTVILLLPMFLFMLKNSEARQHFKKPQWLGGLAIFLAIIGPHFFWLFSNQFITVTYALNRVSEKPTWLNHIYFPAKFAWQQFEAFLPSLLLLLTLLLGKTARNHHQRGMQAILPFDKEFLYFVGAGPLLLTIFLSVIWGINLRAGWGQPLFSLGGILAMTCLQPNIRRQQFYHFVVSLFFLTILMLIGYWFSLTYRGQNSSANFPSQDIADSLTKEWHETFQQPLYYVAGSRWVAGNIGFYSKDHPAVYTNWDHVISPWINENELKRTGAIFIWDKENDHDQATYQEIKHRFSNLGNLQNKQYRRLRSKKGSPIEIKVAFLPAPPHNMKYVNSVHSL